MSTAKQYSAFLIWLDRNGEESGRDEIRFAVERDEKAVNRAHEVLDGYVALYSGEKFCLGIVDCTYSAVRLDAPPSSDRTTVYLESFGACA